MHYFHPQGEVEIRDGDPGSDKVRIEMDKTAATEELLTNFVSNNSVHDIGYGTVFLFQVVGRTLLCIE